MNHAPNARTDRLNDEMVVISNVLADSSQWEAVRHLRPTDFLSPENRRMWMAMAAASLDANGIDPLAVATIDPSLTIERLHEIIAAANPSPAATKAAARRLVDIRRVSQAVAILREGANAIEESLTSRASTDWRATLARTITSATRFGGDERTIGNTELEARLLAQTVTPTKRIRTGISRLDQWLEGGLLPGQMLGIAAETKVGKTVMAASISRNADMMDPPIPHLFFSNERSDDEIGRLKLARRAGIIASRLDTLSDERRRALTREMSPYNSSFVTYKPRATISDLEAEIQYQVQVNGIQLLIVDQLQLIAHDAQARVSDKQHMALVSQELLRITADYNLATIVMVQMTDTGFYAGEAEPFQRSAHAVLHIRRDINAPGTYIQTRASALASESDIGSTVDPSLWLDRSSGPHFRDLMPGDEI